MKLNAFFKVPKASTALPKSPVKDSAGSTSVVEPDNSAAARQASTSPQKPSTSEYHQFFLPFSLPTNATMAQPAAWLMRDEELEEVQASLDCLTHTEDSTFNVRLQSDLLDTFKSEAAIAMLQSAPLTNIPVKDIMTRLHGSSGNPIDLTMEESMFAAETPLQMLKAVPMKYIHFEEDVRPPYYGTCTKHMTNAEVKRLSRSPFARALPATDYDYDSEAEWEEPEEGEDIGSDLDEDGESNEGDEDMEGFLDDENDALRAKRNVATTELEPDCSGLCWEDSKGTLTHADGSDAEDMFAEFRLGILLGK